MNDEPYPNEITKENLPKLVERAELTKKKAQKVMVTFVTLYSIIATLILIFGLPLWGFFVIKTSKPMSPETAIITVIISFLILYQMIVFLLLILLESGTNRLFGLKYEDYIFGECVIIINYLKHDRKKALKEIDNFIISLRGLLRNSNYNSRAKMFSPEFNIIQNGKRQLQRMLLFSNNDLVGLFSDFSLAFIHNQDSIAFFKIREIINEARFYGKMQSLPQRILGRLERYPTFIAIITAIVSLVVTVVLAIALKIIES